MDLELLPRLQNQHGHQRNPIFLCSPVAHLTLLSRQGFHAVCNTVSDPLGRFLNVAVPDRPVDVFTKAFRKGLRSLHRTNHLIIAMTAHCKVMQPLQRDGQCDPAVAVLALEGAEIESVVHAEEVLPKDALDFGGQHDLLFAARPVKFVERHLVALGQLVASAILKPWRPRVGDQTAAALFHGFMTPLDIALDGLFKLEPVDLVYGRVPPNAGSLATA